MKVQVKMKWLTFIFVILFLLPVAVSAHPGRAGKDGCHVCRIHCEKWDVPRGEKHCHKEKSATAPVSGIKSMKSTGSRQKVKVHGWDYKEKEMVSGKKPSKSKD